MNIKEILKDYISYNWIEELITDKQKEDLEGQLDLYINANSLLNLCGVSQQRELLKAFKKNHIHNFGNTPITINELEEYIDSL